MRMFSFHAAGVLSTLSLAAFAALSNNAVAQDECVTATPVVDGANGPFTNVGFTTSLPAWPCAAGGIDVWFSYTATCTGNTTISLCGASYDSCIQVFSGTCGALVSIICNDDSCGLQSQVSVATTLGTTYFIRVGGFASGTGTFPITITPCPPPPVIATNTTVGTGCNVAYASFYENFATSAAFDLVGTNMQMIPVGPAYLMIPGGAYLAPSGGATVLALTDDSSVTVNLTGTGFPHPAGITTQLSVCSNGFVSVAAGNTSTFTPSVTTMLSSPQTCYFGNWHDHNPTIVGSGQVKFEEIGNVAYATWDGVWDYLGTSAASAGSPPATTVKRPS
jgi:hypothetical protein